MIGALGLLKERRFLPLFATQFLGAFNDSLFKQAMVLFATYRIFNHARVESNFNALATGLSILPFFFLSALSGQLADTIDKAKIIRWVKTAEICIMVFGSLGLLLARGGHTAIGLTVMLITVLMLGGAFDVLRTDQIRHPAAASRRRSRARRHRPDRGRHLSVDPAGHDRWPDRSPSSRSVIAVLVVDLGDRLDRRTRGSARAAPRAAEVEISHNPFSSSWRLISATMHIPRLFLAICAISFFWTIGAVLIVIFPPLVKNLLTADRQVASLVIAMFSIGIAIGSVVINRLLERTNFGQVRARIGDRDGRSSWSCSRCSCAPGSPSAAGPHVRHRVRFIAEPRAIPIVLSLMAIAITGGMFVVPLYAFLHHHRQPRTRRRGPWPPTTSSIQARW